MTYRDFTRLLGCFVFILGLTPSFAQSPYYLPGTRAHEIHDRWEVLHWRTKSANQLSSIGNISRKGLLKSVHTTATGAQLSPLDAADYQYILDDNVNYISELEGDVLLSKDRVYEADGVFYSIADDSVVASTSIVSQSKGWNLWNTFYKEPANFFRIETEDFQLVANPILNLAYGAAQDDDNIVFHNLRGIELHGTIDKVFYFYTNVLENQARFNNFIERRIDRDGAIPGQGFFKNYESGVIDNLTGWDYLNSQAYFGAQVSKSVAVELGHGKHFIGNGIRSLLLSDYGNNYFYLKLNTRIWKFQYQNIFAELAPISSRLNAGNTLLPKKYMATHYLSYALRDNMEIGLFETVVFSRQDQFELQYLNPVILYRTVEQFLDSPDNALVGINGKWNIFDGIQLYGQLILDEFKLSEITAGNGWWANKYGLQTGVKYYNVANVDHLDVQVEYNTARPYTYAHRDTLEGFPNQNIASYTHYNQPLAHPLGANFKELLFEVRYRPTARLSMKARAIRATWGQDPTGTNFGSNPLLPLESREADFGNFTGQGITTDINLMSLDVSYQLYHNMNLDLRYLRREEDATDDALDLTTNYIGMALRVNIGQVTWDY